MDILIDLVKYQKHISAVFGALAGPTRRRFLDRLANGGERPVSDLAKPFRISSPIAGAGEFRITGTYEETVVPERIYYHADLGMAIMGVRIEFFDLGRHAKVVLTQDEGSCKIVSQGTQESFDKLDSMLAGHAVANQE